MERKKLLKRMAIIASIMAVLSAVTLFFESVHTQVLKDERTQKKNNQIAQLTDHYQKFLDGIAVKINDITISPEVISRANSEILRKKPKTKLYLWMSETRGEFVFGVPSPVFIRLNKIYDKYHNIFEKDGYYVNRDDFLGKLVLKHDEINFSRFDFGREKSNIKEWRFFRGRLSNRHDSRTIRLSLSTPVFNHDNQILGDLYLIAEVSSMQVTDEIFESSFFEGFFEFSHALFGFSLFFLWLLIPSWVYIDARLRDVKNASKWALLTVISCGFAAIIYSIVRPVGLKSFYCPECEKELNGTKAFCPYCGFDLSAAFCPQCQYPLKPEWEFCPSCRYDLRSKIIQEKIEKK